MLLIVDLDDTIYSVKSISPQVVEPAIALVRDALKKMAPTEKRETIIQELWENPFDVIAQKYDFPNSLINSFYQKINTLNFNLSITPFPDYHYLKEIAAPKILVTTGFKKLQDAKIRQLGIAADFQEIFIDDPSSASRIGKKEIFKNSQQNRQLATRDIWIIGDSESSEIKAGLELKYNTIRRINTVTNYSTKADFTISTFAELPGILFPNN